MVMACEMPDSEWPVRWISRLVCVQISLYKAKKSRLIGNCGKSERRARKTMTAVPGLKM